MSKLAIDQLSSRRAALDTLEAVVTQRRECDAALAQHLPVNLPPQDKAFAQRLVVTALRHDGIIRHILKQLVSKPLPQRYQRVELILALGIAQLYWMEVPDYAAVNTMVDLAKKSGFQSHAGLVNAVLKNAAKQKATLLEKCGSGRVNTPNWLWQRWAAAYGEATAERIAAAHLSEPPLDLSFISATAREKFSALFEGASRVLPIGTLRLSHPGAVTKLPDYQNGTWWVQDAAAALPARLLGDLTGKRVLDLCAAPGGKTAQLAAAGGRVTAVEKSDKRIKQLKENLARLKMEAEVVCADAADYAPSAPADAVLLDAPCSATGTLRRHPDVALLRTETDIARLAEIQARLLRHAATLVKPGGVLVYAVCSLEPEEGEAQIAAFLAAHAAFRRVPVTASEVSDQAAFITSDGDLRTLPCHWPESGGLDGFFAARLQNTTNSG